MKISGKIIDEQGNALYGANIIKFGNNSVNTSTDKNGNFIIDNPNIVTFDNFKISFVGFKTQMKKASELQGQKIILPMDIEMLDEVVIPAKPKPIQEETKKYNKPLIIVGSLGLMVLGFFLIKKYSV